MATAAKHFEGYGASVGGRDYDATPGTGNDLHDIHPPPFRAALRAGKPQRQSRAQLSFRASATSGRPAGAESLHARPGEDLTEEDIFTRALDETPPAYVAGDVDYGTEVPLNSRRDALPRRLFGGTSCEIRIEGRSLRNQDREKG
jgi:hypothetical protein